MSNNLKAISVSELTAKIKGILEDGFDNILISGEISNFKHHYSGHMYFTIKDDGAEIRAVMFKGHNQYLRFKPEDGMQVIAGGRLTVYEQRGQYQLVLKQMEPSGIGTLYLAFEALKKQLAEEGLFDDDRKLELPKYPNKVGVITSKSGAAVQDIFQVLERRSPFIDIILRPAKVQGEGAAQDIANAINEFNEYGEVDVLIIGRGGGSLEDLWPFNEEIVARAISNSVIPIISAVGHETDFSISDMVADHRAPTPSAAAEIVSSSINEMVDYLYGYKSRMDYIISSLLEKNWQRLDDIYNRHSRLNPQNVIDAQKKELKQLSDRLFNSITYRHEQLDMQIKPLSEKLSVLNPKSILQRGYSVAFNIPDRDIIKASADIEDGKKFQLLTGEGSFTAKKLKNIKEQ